jgi:hypothetical protein
MTEAGMKLPTVKFRIWHWLKDHPEKTAEDIKKALGLNYLPYEVLHEMTKADTLKVYGDVSRKTSIHGLHPKIKRYSVTNAQEYEPPLRKKRTTKKVKTIATQRVFDSAMRVIEAKAAPRIEVAPAPAPGLTEAEKFAAFLEYKALMKEMKK